MERVRFQASLVEEASLQVSTTTEEKEAAPARLGAVEAMVFGVFEFYRGYEQETV